MNHGALKKKRITGGQIAYLFWATVSSGITIDSASAAFVGPLALDHWIFTKSLASSNADIDLTQAPDAFTLHGSNSGSGRASTDAFSATYPTNAPLIPLDSSLVDLDVLPIDRLDSYPGPVIYNYKYEYTTTLATLAINFDWTYETNDVDGPIMDPLYCSPACTGFDPLGPANQSGRGEAIYRESLGWSLEQEQIENPFQTDDTKIYSVRKPIKIGLPDTIMLLAQINSVDSSIGGARITWSNFSVNLNHQSVSGELTNTGSTVPIPAAAWLFGSALIGLARVTRRSNES